MFHIPAHKNVTHPAAQVRNEPRDALATGGTVVFLAAIAFSALSGLLVTAGLALRTLVS